MKKLTIGITLLIVALAITGCDLLTGRGKEQVPSDMIGRWEAVSITFPIEEIYEKEISFEPQGDGSCLFTYDGTTYTLSWELDGDSFQMIVPDSATDKSDGLIMAGTRNGYEMVITDVMGISGDMLFIQSDPNDSIYGKWIARRVTISVTGIDNADASMDLQENNKAVFYLSDEVYDDAVWALEGENFTVTILASQAEGDKDSRYTGTFDGEFVTLANVGDMGYDITFVKK
ncbi:MAG: hypothetical protein FWD41_04235 [Actinomycetia bacterium]|nr:hypothetical protein [Actinomycetes bacterium]